MSSALCRECLQGDRGPCAGGGLLDVGSEQCLLAKLFSSLSGGCWGGGGIKIMSSRFDLC